MGQIFSTWYNTGQWVRFESTLSVYFGRFFLPDIRVPLEILYKMMAPTSDFRLLKMSLPDLEMSVGNTAVSLSVLATAINRTVSLLKPPKSNGYM